MVLETEEGQGKVPGWRMRRRNWDHALKHMVPNFLLRLPGILPQRNLPMRRSFLLCFCLLVSLAVMAQADPSATCSLSSTVRDRDGKPLAGVWLTLTPAGGLTMTDGKGAAVFRDLPPGSYTVSLAAAGYYPVASTVTLSAHAISSIDFTLEKGGASNIRIHGTAGGSDQIIVPPVPRPATPPPEYLLTPPVLPGSGPAWRMAQEDVLREAVFRYLFALSPYTRRFPVYYLSVRGFPWEQGMKGSKDPDAAFLARFRGSKPPVQAVSAFPFGSKDWNNPVKSHWIIFRVSSIKWTSGTQLEISCGSAQSGYSSSDSLFLNCTLRHGKWEIIGITEVSA